MEWFINKIWTHILFSVTDSHNEERCPRQWQKPQGNTDVFIQFHRLSTNKNKRNIQQKKHNGSTTLDVVQILVSAKK